MRQKVFKSRFLRRFQVGLDLLFGERIFLLIGGDNRGGNRGGNLVLGLPEEQRRICEMLIANPRMSVRGIAAALNVRPRTVEKQIAALKVKNVVVREGGTRGYWRVILG